MIKKSLLVSALSFLIVVGISFFIEGPNQVAREYPLQFLFMMLLYGGVPFIAVGFVVLLGFNSIIEKLIANKPKKEKEKRYWLLGAASCLLPIFGFVLYDISSYGKYGHLFFFKVLFSYSPFFILAIVALILNRKIVWRSFV